MWPCLRDWLYVFLYSFTVSTRLWNSFLLETRKTMTWTYTYTIVKYMYKMNFIRRFTEVWTLMVQFTVSDTHTRELWKSLHRRWYDVLRLCGCWASYGTFFMNHREINLVSIALLYLQFYWLYMILFFIEVTCLCSVYRLGPTLAYQQNCIQLVDR